ncbi:hypothetical protein P5673_012978 [Acropora cervicornis]|uniref:Uncharacterized protein n=1 Tax=Acropora cervicornis TaxID=6130 RepID=A0AAD9V7F5_ACRCE|nr:hypothetical protein P5673_012978 [Acropora cervicornis]
MSFKFVKNKKPPLGNKSPVPDLLCEMQLKTSYHGGKYRDKRDEGEVRGSLENRKKRIRTVSWLTHGFLIQKLKTNH